MGRVASLFPRRQAEAEWFANIENTRTRRAYRIDLQDFMTFVGIAAPEEFRVVTRSHVIAWRKLLESRGAAPATVRRKLAALSSLFEHLCESNAVPHNPVKGVKRPKAEGNEGKTPAIGDAQARQLLDAPDPESLKGKRDRAILSTFLFHGLRREELCTLKVRDLQPRRGVPHFRVHGKGGKTRYVPAHPQTLERVEDYPRGGRAQGRPQRPALPPGEEQRDRGAREGAHAGRGL